MSKTKGSLDEAACQTRITWASLSSTSSPRSTWCRQGFVFIMPLGLYLYIEFIRICIFLLQAETFASNLRENLDRVRQTEAFKAYNATFQMLSAASNVTFDSRFWTKTTLNHPIIPIIPEPLFTIQLFQIGPILFSTFQSGLSYLKVSSSTSERQWMLWTRCGALSWRSVKKYRLNNK